MNLFSLGHDLAAHLKARALDRQSVKHANLFRVRLLGWLAFIIFFALTYRLLLISVPRTFSFSLFPNWAESGPITFSSRSDLLDRHGEILATNIPIYHFAIRPKKIKNKDVFIDSVLPLISGISRSNLYKKVHSSKNYVYVKKKISDAARKKLLALQDPAIEFEKIDLRAYPKKQILAHLVGFTGTENTGLKGLEYGLDGLILKDPEQQIKLACDARFQEIIYIALKDGIEKYSAKGGGAILMKADTGEILSLISMPDFDPNDISKSPVENRFNKMISGVYEPGSVFKLFNTAMAIEEGLEDKWYDVQKPLKVGRFHINDLHKMEGKKAQLDQILIHSSNIGSGQMAWDIGAKKQKSYFEKFGF
ncbi:MAG: hypothetical protein JW812_00750, partial [Alphaproteobacteria bacterium]|nr:hypothetical protein [Alphaproteobacteria bacterium]